MVYSDHQRLELEKEFHYSRYITIRRKAELAANLGLSERQVSQPYAEPGESNPHPHIHFNIILVSQEMSSYIRAYLQS